MKDQTNSAALAVAKKLIQLTAVRLQVAKQEEQLKADLDKLMTDSKLETAEGVVMLDGRKVHLAVNKKQVSVTSLDITKLSSMMTHEQFMSCASITQTAAKKVLPQSLIDQCLVAGEPRISYAVTADKGHPVPQVKLFP